MIPCVQCSDGPSPVRMGESFCDLQTVAYNLCYGEFASFRIESFELLFQGSAGEILKNKEPLAFRLIDVVDCGNVGISQGGDRSGFLLESRNLIG